MADNNLVDLQGVPLLFTEDLKMGTLPFSAKMSTLFVPEEDEEYQLLPQAPRRLLSKKIRASRPWVWQSLQRMASSEAEPSGEKQGDESCFQLRKMTVNPLMSALQELLPKSWNVKIPEVTNDDWAWVETWLRTLWNWLSRMSVPTKQMLHWPIVPSVREPDETQVHEGKNSAGEAGEVAEAPPIRTVRLYRLLPNSTLFNARPTQSAESTSSGLLDGHLGKDLVELMEKIHCTPVWLPDWLRNRESQLAGFVHPGTADGLMKACHNLLHQLPKKGDQDTKEGDHSPASKLRKKWCPNSKQQSALAAWLVMAGPEHCDCPRVAPVGSDVGWRLNCEIFRAAPLFSPFSRKELVALVDSQSGHGGQDGSRHWSLLPEACPEVAAALRASDIPMPGCVEPADAENVAALVRELHMPRLTWAEVLLEHVFPWASTNTVQPAARQGLMLAVVQRWREMELAGHEQCVEALQQVSFIPSVDGPMRSPSTLLDPRKEELKLLYMGEGPFPATEVNAVLLPLLQRGLLRFREELSLKELHERLTFLDRKHELEETSSAEWDKVRACADSFLQYVATNVSIKCQEVARSAAAAVPVAGDPLPPAATAVERKYQSFFAWPLAMPDFLSTSSAKSGPAMPDSLAKKEEWSEDDVEQLKCQLRRCRWMPAAKAPREWLEAICWAGSAHRLWRPSDLVLMSEFWVSGAANPLLDPETQVVFSSEKKERLLSDFLKLVGISKDYPESERVKRAWAQLEAIRSWLEVNPRNERKDSEAESAWISNCLYQHVYPLIASEFQVESDPDPERQYLKDIFVAGAFVPLEDLSVSQDFHLARLYQIPKELQSTASRLCSQVRPSFHAKDLARGLHRLSGSPQLTHVETDTAVHLAMALSERVRTDGEPLPERVMLPTSQGKLRLAHECVFNNMPWLSEEEQQKRSRAVTQRGLHWVHPSISNDVAGTLKVQALSTQVAAEALAAADDGEKDPEWFEAAGQTEPLTTRLRSLLRDISSDSEDLGLFKSLLQNADDAQAKEVHFVWDWRSFGKQSLMSPEMARWQGPCLWAHNNASFSPQDFENITQLGAVKTKNKAQIGRFGLGFNSVYSVTDLPSILSDDVVLFLDPHVQHLRAMGASPAKPGIKLRFLKIDVLDKFRDQFEPYHGMFGCDLASSTPYQGTLIRLPFRTAESAAASEISKTVLAPKAAMAFLRAFRNAAAECLMFLQHVQRIEFIWIPPDGNAKPTIMELKIVPPGIPVSLPCGAAEQASQATVTEVSTAEQALEYRRLFSSRTVAQSKEKQSFISEMLSRLGMSKPDSSGNVTTVASHISFNLVISISWSPSTELQKEFHTKPGDRKEAWRLILQHDNLEDERWKMSGADEGFDYVPFAGLALCLSRQLRAKEPRICCFLPLPVNANCSLPFLINGNFCLSDPTAPGRLDLARGSSDGASTWNTLLLRNMIEPLICALIQDQAKKLQVGSTTFRSDVAAWTEDVCSLMPQKSQLPSSLKELLNLPSIYKTLGGSKLFPLAFKTGAQPLADFLGSKEPLLSYVDSVQPLEDTVATPEERQAVHEYLSSEVNAFRFCHVTPEVAQEFSFAGLQRKAKVEQSLLLHCLQKDLQCKYTCSTASKLLSFLLADDSSSVATSLQGLKLAPLCDGKVASFGKEGSDPVLCCAFAFTHAARSSFAQRVLQALAPKETLDLSGIDQASLNNLRQHANQLGIRQVETCEQLASALLSGFPNLRAPPKSRTLAGASVLESLDETLGGRLLAGSSRQATAASLFGFGNDASANATLCALWSFVELAEDGFSDQFLSDFDRFYVVPAWDPNHRPFTEPGSATAVEMPLVLVPLSASEPLLLPECDESLKPLMEIAAALVPDRFVDKGHPAMSDPVLQFLKQTGVLHHFSRGSFLRVLGSSEGSLGRCQRLNPQQRVLLRSQLCQALCDPIDDGQSQAMARASVVCKLPIFLAESATDESNAQAFRPLLQLAVVDGEPLTLTSPPVRLDLDTVFVFLASAKTHREVAEALKLPEVKEIMTEEGKYFDVKTWLQKQVVPHLESMIPEDQVIVLERLLPLIQEIPEANNEPYLIPAEARSKMMKPPLLILDPQDFTIQEIFGIRGEDWPALDLRHRYQFPSKALPASVLSHLRRLGMRRSIGDGACLAFLCQAFFVW
ncbi:Sacsin (DnaJ homolog subfamily C member 29) (DNAJC29) [Durusdinium trenchii]|uniref:Sacsin (DnaJ homolog subfamily C member 29) (DNAJC29) n=1 Tax=Durusdinium trenchii TaxID=1381693 RepID=A0ABP0S4M1_9DINO